MNMREIKEKAKELNIKPGKKRKGELIRFIQTTEGNFPCFDYAQDFCDQLKCCWRNDCLKLKSN